MENNDDMDLDDNNMINVCGPVIDIEKITKQEILKMRKYLPKKDYRYVNAFLLIIILSISS